MRDSTSKTRSEDDGDLPFEEVVRRLLAAPVHHKPTKPPLNGKQQPKKKPAPERKPR
jgi:hypothetical protein